MGIKRKAIRIAVEIIRGKYVMAGVPVIIRNQKGEILLGKRAKNITFYPSMWGLPGGFINYHESIEKAAKREVKEEIGVEIQVKKQGKPYMQFPTKDCPVQTLNIPLHCKITRGKPKPKDETEEIHWFAPQKIKKMKLAYSHKKILEQEGI